MPKPYITKFRPTELDEFFGNKAVIKLCKKLVEDEDDRPQTYLLKGEKGCGKTSLARVLAMEFGADESQIIEIDCLQDRSIDMIRNLVDMTKSAPIVGSSKCFIIDECHELPKLSQEGLLKSTEEPPDYVYYFLCSTEPQRIWGTLRDRCFELEMKRLSPSQTAALIAQICVQEEIELDDIKLTKEIVRYAEGNPRKILKAIYYAKNLDSPEELREILGTVDTEDPEIVDLCRYLTYQKGNPIKILSGLKDKDAEGARRAVLKYTEKALLDPKNKGKVLRLLTTADNFQQPFYNGMIDLILATFASVD